MPHDARIRVLVRNTLSRHWIDVAKIRVHVTRGNVRLSGELCRLPGHSVQNIDSDALIQIATEIQQIPDVARVYLTDVKLQKAALSPQELENTSKVFEQ